MFAALNQFFSMLFTLFSAGEKGAKAIEHLATWSEEKAATFVDEARIERKSTLKALYAETGVIITEDGRVVDPEYQRMVAEQTQAKVSTALGAKKAPAKVAAAA